MTMRDNGTPTKITTKIGKTPVYLADKPCTACGCFEAFVFECNCGAIHSDICYNCGRYVDMKHEPQSQERCEVGQVEHEHTDF